MKDPADIFLRQSCPRSQASLRPGRIQRLLFARCEQPEIRDREQIFYVKVTKVKHINRPGKIKTQTGRNTSVVQSATNARIVTLPHPPPHCCGWLPPPTPTPPGGDEKSRCRVLSRGSVFTWQYAEANPTSAGRRSRQSTHYKRDHARPSEKSLVAKKSSTGGTQQTKAGHRRRHRGGGNKTRYRIIDFKRNKDARARGVASIEYDPTATAACAVALSRREKRYILGRRVWASAGNVVSRVRGQKSARASAAAAIHPPSARVHKSSCVRVAAARWPLRGTRGPVDRKERNTRNCACRRQRCAAVSMPGNGGEVRKLRARTHSRSAKRTQAVGRAGVHRRAVSH